MDPSLPLAHIMNYYNQSGSRVHLKLQLLKKRGLNIYSTSMSRIFFSNPLVDFLFEINNANLSEIFFESF